MAQIDPQTETAVGNEALAHLLIQGITDLDNDTSLSGRTLRTHFATTRDALQRQYPWNFCEVRKRLYPDPDVRQVIGFRYSYALPPDCLKARQLHGHRERDWKVSGRSILTNHGPHIDLIYTGRVTTVSLWDALFREAYALALAVKCKILQKDPEITQEIEKKAAEALAAAWPVDASEGIPDEIPPVEAVAIRDIGMGYPWGRR